MADILNFNKARKQRDRSSGGDLYRDQAQHSGGFREEIAMSRFETSACRIDPSTKAHDYMRDRICASN